MNKMEQELENRLDQNKHELYDVLWELTKLTDLIIQGEYKPDTFTTQPAHAILAKIERGGDAYKTSSLPQSIHGLPKIKKEET